MPPVAIDRTIRGYEFDPLIDRVETLEAKHETHGELVTGIRIDLQGIKTAIKIWGVIGTLGAPMLCALAAWLVLKAAAVEPTVSSSKSAATIRADR